MKKVIKLTESDLRKIVKRVLLETDDNKGVGKFFTLGGHYFYVDGSKMYLADKSKGELSPNLMVEFPSTKEISAIWGESTREVDIPEIKGKELKGLKFDDKMKNAISYGKDIYSKNEAVVNFGSLIPIVYYSLKHEAPTLGGFIIGTDFQDGVEGRLITIDEPKIGDKIYFQQSTFKAGKEYGINLEVSMQGQPISVEDFGVTNNSLKLPKIYNVGEFFEENSAEPKNLDRASFVEGVKKFLKDGGKINKITIDAASSKIPAGNVGNDRSGKKWKELNEYDDLIIGNNDDGTGNLQLCRHKAMNTYNQLKKTIPELASAPYILKASGPVGSGYVHIKFE